MVFAERTSASRPVDQRRMISRRTSSNPGRPPRPEGGK